MSSEIVKALHVKLEGYSAFFRVAWSVTASQMTLPCPPYPTLLGLISTCAGKVITPADTRIGYEFNHASEGEELERTKRFELTEAGYLQAQKKGQGLLYRQVHFKPILDLYLDNLQLDGAFKNPVATPTLGRSQDLCWITKVEEVELIPRKNGMIGSTMIRSSLLKGSYITPEVVNAVEWFNNSIPGAPRQVASKGLFQALQPDGNRLHVEIANLYHPSNLPNEQDVIYLHEWSAH